MQNSFETEEKRQTGKKFFGDTHIELKNYLKMTNKKWFSRKGHKGLA